MLSSVEQAFVGREEIRAPLKTPAWEARLLAAVPERNKIRTARAAEIQPDQYKISGKLPTHPSPNPTFFSKLELSVNVDLGEG